MLLIKKRKRKKVIVGVVTEKKLRLGSDSLAQKGPVQLSDTVIDRIPLSRTTFQGRMP